MLPLPLYLLACLVATLAVAWLSWTFVESPALAYNSWSPRRAGQPAVPAVDPEVDTVVIEPVR